MLRRLALLIDEGLPRISSERCPEPFTGQVLATVWESVRLQQYFVDPLQYTFSPVGDKVAPMQ
jgi:hypothetical protein